MERRHHSHSRGKDISSLPLGIAVIISTAVALGYFNSEQNTETQTPPATESTPLVEATPEPTITPTETQVPTPTLNGILLPIESTQFSTPTVQIPPLFSTAAADKR